MVFLYTNSLPQSASQTAPSSEGAKEDAIKRVRQIIIYRIKKVEAKLHRKINI